MGESASETPDLKHILNEHVSGQQRAFVSRGELFAALRMPNTQRGLLAIAAGLALLLWPDRTFVVTVGVAGLVILLGGLSAIWGWSRERDTASAVKGLATVLLGALMLVYRRRSAEFLANLIAVIAAIASLLDIGRAVRAKRRGEPWLWFLARAIAEGAVALITFAVGSFTVELVLFASAVLWITTGVITIWHSVLYQNDETPHTIDPARIAYEWFQARDLGDATRAVVVRNLIFDRDELRVRATRFIALMGFSTAIAAFGIQTDSTAVVIGAMLVAPLMTPIMATSISLVMGWRFRAMRSLGLVIVGAILSILIAYVIGRYFPSFIDTNSNLQITSRVSPTMFDLLIALTAGAAGGYAVVRQDVSDSLPGVAISVALVPPLAVVGITLASGNGSQALGALLLFVTNFVGIILTSGIVFVFVGFSTWSRIQANRKEIRQSVLLVAVALILIAIPLAITGQNILSTSVNQNEALEATEEWGAQSADLEFVRLTRTGNLVEIVMVGSGTPGDLDELADELSDIYGEDVDIELDVVPKTTYTTKDE